MTPGARRLLALGAVVVSFSTACKERAAAPAPDASPLAHVEPVEASAPPPKESTPDAGMIDDRAMPAMSGEDLDNRMRHLLEALAQNNPDLGADALFPRDAYGASHDAKDALAEWEKRVHSPFRRSVERVHKKLRGIERAKFVSFEPGRAIMQVSTKKRSFTKPLWRVKHSKLTLSIDGKSHPIEIAEMIAWRGAWYITKLR
jgi:hypothetical protein